MNATNREFVESSVFSAYIKKQGSDNDLRRLQNEILQNPKIGVILRGTGGVRKFRFAIGGKGKSGGWRILFLDLPEVERTYLLLAFGKDEKANISAEEAGEINHLVEAIKREARK